MSTPTLAQALDIAYGTLQAIVRKDPPMTYAYSNYAFMNTFWRSGKKTVGDALEGYITLDREGNARHSGFWDEDSTTKKNIQGKFSADWKHADGSMVWNLIEMSINSSPARIYNVWESQYKACVTDLIDAILLKILTGPTSSTDTNSPYSVFSWLPLGTDDSEGDWTGYSGHYNDGSTPGSTFNRGGLASSSSSNSRFAGWYADHNGNLDDSLLTLCNNMALDQNFQAPMVTGDKLTVDNVGKVAFYTNKNVITSLNSYYAMSDDNMGYHPNSHYNTPVLNGIPLIYTPPLNTANTSVYGTDPIVGLNSNYIYPVVLPGWDFTVNKRPDSLRHNVVTLFMDVVYQIWCENPRHAGGLISQQ